MLSQRSGKIWQIMGGLQEKKSTKNPPRFIA
jgi:hypothetical protein